MESSFLSMNESYFCNKERNLRLYSRATSKNQILQKIFQTQQLTMYLQMKSSSQQGFWEKNVSVITDD